MENYPSTMIMLVRSREIISKVIWRFKNSCWADRQTSSRRSLKVTSQLDSAVEIQVATESDVPNERFSYVYYQHKFICCSYNTMRACEWLDHCNSLTSFSNDNAANVLLYANNNFENKTNQPIFCFTISLTKDLQYIIKCLFITSIPCVLHIFTLLRFKRIWWMSYPHYESICLLKLRSRFN